MSGMSDDVRYETSEWAARRGAPIGRYSFPDALIRWGVVSTREQAEYALLGVSGVAIVIALFFMRGAFSSSTNTDPNKENQARLMEESLGSQWQVR